MRPSGFGREVRDSFSRFPGFLRGSARFHADVVVVILLMIAELLRARAVVKIFISIAK